VAQNPASTAQIFFDRAETPAIKLVRFGHSAVDEELDASDAATFVGSKERDDFGSIPRSIVNAAFSSSLYSLYVEREFAANPAAPFLSSAIWNGVVLDDLLRR
jgi:hypothetical protein